MARRQHVTVLFALAVMALITLSYMMSSSSNSPRIPSVDDFSSSPSGRSKSTKNIEVSQDVLSGDVIAPKLANATAKAELGRASWKLFHTMMARFPEKPTPDESLALKTYITLFARLYPCGDCARHFQQLLAKYPPQVGSRNAASGWACLVHNEVNKRLKKPEFDCTKLDYDCGCGEDEKREKEENEGKGKSGKGREEGLKERANISLDREEGLTRGG